MQRSITTRQLLLILGSTLVLIGALLGFLPISFDGGPCGSAFGSDKAMDVESLTRSMIGTGAGWREFDAGCTTARSDRRTLALVLLLPGLVLAGASLFVGGTPRNDDTPATD